MQVLEGQSLLPVDGIIVDQSRPIPAKALRENPGLKDISYSITGGALVCQGQSKSLKMYEHQLTVRRLLDALPSCQRNRGYVLLRHTLGTHTGLWERLSSDL
jgi:hypothetical protein